MDSQKALQLLKQGNDRFVAGKMIERDYLAEVKATAPGQSPFASIVSCLDSRVIPETIFDQGIGDLFVARIAGNFVNDDILGSLEFAASVSSKLIVIMGHTSCGAIKGACGQAQSGLLAVTLSNISEAVEAVEGDYSPRNETNPEFLQAVAEMNVKKTIEKSTHRSLVLRNLIESGEVGIVGAMYNVETARVTFA